MSRRVSIAVAAAVLLALGFVVARYSRANLSPVGTSSKPVAPPSIAYDERLVRDRDIAFFAGRIAEDPESAIDRMVLARLYFARSRNSGSMADLAKAEHLASESIVKREHRNYQAFELLASTLMGRHAFREAHAVMSRVDSLDPAIPSHVALLGEIELELGDYDAAAKRFSSIQYDGRNFTIGARLARWHEITGHSDRARAFLKESIKRVSKRDDLPREQVAWFYFRLGDLELKAGRTAAADSAFRAALVVNPEDPRVLSEFAHIAYKDGDFRNAAAYGERVIESHRDPELLAVMASSYRNLGNIPKAELYARATVEKNKVEPGVIHRPWGLFILDYGTADERAHVLELARRERQIRNDVYAHDLLAWALFRTGHTQEARREMRLALSQNTQDVMLSDHARRIGLPET